MAGVDMPPDGGNLPDGGVRPITARLELETDQDLTLTFGERTTLNELFEMIRERVAKVYPNAKKIKHIGFAGIQASKGLLDMDKLIKHFMKVNDVDKKAFDKHHEEAFKVWRERSQKEWTTDLAQWSSLVSPP